MNELNFMVRKYDFGGGNAFAAVPVHQDMVRTQGLWFVTILYADHINNKDAARRALVKASPNFFSFAILYVVAEF